MGADTEAVKQGLGGLVGLFVGAALGLGGGFLLIAWFAPASCCGLEGMGAPAYGIAIGAVTGLVSGIVVARRQDQGGSTRRLLTFLVVFLGCFAAVWILGNTVLSFDYEDLGWIVIFHLLTLVTPAVLWLQLNRRHRGSPTAP